MMNIPKLRFKGFDDKIDSYYLSELCTTFSGGTPSSTNKKYYCGKIPFIKSGEISRERTEQFINEEALINSSAKLVVKGDILYALYGATSGQVAISKLDGAINQAVLCIRPTNINTFYLYTFLKNKKEDILGKYLQGGQGNLSANILKGLIIPFPTLPEQEKIASFFTAVDSRLEKLKKKKELLEQYKIGVMQKIFSQELRFKDEKGNNFPDWEEKKLGDVGTTYSGLAGKSGDDFGSGKPYIQYKQIFDNSKIDISKFGFVNIEENENQNQVKYGDVLFTVSSETPKEIGYASVILDEIDELYLNSFCFGYRANSLEELLPSYLRFYFRSNFFRKDIYKLAQGSTRYNMSKREFLKLNIYIPCNQEQQKIAKFLTALDKKIDLVNQQISKTELWKKGLLQQMFV